MLKRLRSTLAGLPGASSIFGLPVAGGRVDNGSRLGHHGRRGGIRMGQARLVVEGRGNWEYTHLMGDAQRVMIGRGPENDIDLNDFHVSSRHAELSLDGDQYALRDLGSRNGTYVNRKKIESSPVHHKDRIRVGTTTMTFLTDSDESFRADDIERMREVREGYVARPEPEADRSVDQLSSEELREELRLSRVRLHRLVIANEFLRQIARQPSELHMMTVAVNFISRQVDAETGFIMQIDPKTGKWAIRGRFGAILDWSHTGEDETRIQLPMSLTIVEQVIANAKPVLSRSAIEDPRFDSAKSINALGIHSCMCFPLMFQDKPHGVVYVDRRASTKSFDTWEERLFQVLTDQLNRVLYPIPSTFRF